MSIFPHENHVVVRNMVIAFACLCVLTAALLRAMPPLRAPLPTALLGMTMLLLLVRPIEKEIRAGSRFRKRILLIGNRPLAHPYLDAIEAAPEKGHTVVGVVEETPSHLNRTPWLVLGTIADLQTIVDAVRPNRIVLALSDRRGRLPGEVLLGLQADGIVVEDIVDAYERFTGKLAIEEVTPGQLIASRTLCKPRRLTAMQRLLSFTIALVLLVVLAPVLAIIALAIRLDSGSPVLFRQLRLGRKGRPFHLIKFRTMHPLDEPASQWAQDNLTRITRIGRWLRGLRLDELPQLINVIRGEMNLVGPRPHPASNGDLFLESIPYYSLRCSVRPGITGWAQTRYCYANNLEEETEKMRFDLFYIRHMSLWMDLRITFDTFALFVASWFAARRGVRRGGAEPVVRAKSPRLYLPRPRREAPVAATVLPFVQYASDSDEIPMVPASTVLAGFPLVAEVTEMPRIPIQPEAGQG